MARLLAQRLCLMLVQLHAATVTVGNCRSSIMELEAIRVTVTIMVRVTCERGDP